MALKALIDILSRVKFKTVPSNHGFNLVSTNLPQMQARKFVCNVFPQLRK